MRAVLSRSSLVAILGALAMAFALAMMVLSSSAGAVPGPKKAWCHATGSESHPFVIVVVQAGGSRDVAHEGHSDDILLAGPEVGLKKADFSLSECVEGGTTGTPPPTTTTGTPPPTTPPPTNN